MDSSAFKGVQVGRREDSRVRVRLKACLVTVAGTHRVRLNNLSEGGASVTVDEPLKRGSDVILQFCDIEAFARVTWVEGSRCGLKFDEPLSREAVLFARSLSDNRASVERTEHLAAVRDFTRGTLRLGYGD